MAGSGRANVVDLTNDSDEDASPTLSLDAWGARKHRDKPNARDVSPQDPIDVFKNGHLAGSSQVDSTPISTVRSKPLIGPRGTLAARGGRVSGGSKHGLLTWKTPQTPPAGSFSAAVAQKIPQRAPKRREHVSSSPISGDRPISSADQNVQSFTIQQSNNAPPKSQPSLATAAIQTPPAASSLKDKQSPSLRPSPTAKTAEPVTTLGSESLHGTTVQSTTPSVAAVAGSKRSADGTIVARPSGKSKASMAILNSVAAGTKIFNHRDSLDQPRTDTLLPSFDSHQGRENDPTPLVRVETSAGPADRVAPAAPSQQLTHHDMTHRASSNVILKPHLQASQNIESLPTVPNAELTTTPSANLPDRPDNAVPAAPAGGQLSDSANVKDPRDIAVLTLVKKYGDEETLRLFNLLNRDWTQNQFMKGWNDQEDDFLKHIKENLNLKWSEIVKFFPNRSSWHTVQSRYAQKLKDRGTVPSSSWTPKAKIPFSRASDSDSADDAEQDGETGVPSRRTTRTGGVHQPGKYELPPPDIGSQQDEIHPSPQPGPLRPLEESSKPPVQTIGGRQLMRGGPHPASTSIGPLNIPVCRVQSLEAPGEAARRALQAREKLEFDLASLAAPPKKDCQNIREVYMRYEERSFAGRSLKTSLWDRRIDQAWDGTTLHVDLDDDEIASIEPLVGPIRNLQIPPDGSDLDAVARLETLMPGASRKQTRQIAETAKQNPVLASRSRKTVKHFLHDCAHSQVNRPANLLQLRVRPLVDTSVGVSARATSALLRNREISGLKSHRHIEAMSTSFGPKQVFRGASSDINVVAWAPDGNRFCAGTTCFTDDQNLQYNRENNLFFGDIRTDDLLELPEHMVPRKAVSGINAQHAMLASQDPWIFKSITAIQFTSDNRSMITGGHDGVSRVWDITGAKPRCTLAFPEKVSKQEDSKETWIETIATNSKGLFAIGRNHGPEPIRVYRYRLDDPAAADHQRVEFNAKEYKVAKVESRRPQPESVKPTSLRFGPESQGQDRYLLCGLGSVTDDIGGSSRGEVLVWDVEAAQPVFSHCGFRNVFDVNWHHTIYGRFAVSCVAPRGVNRGTYSVIRLYDSRQHYSEMKCDTTHGFELECPARDINETVWHPHNDYLISAGCTDGKVYTWDTRAGEELLHVFQHEKTLSLHMPDDVLEDVDTGVNFISYGPGSRLYTGSSDGIVASWDPLRSTEDAFCRTVARLESGVYRGAFSPDNSNLLLGEHSGTLSMWSVGLEDRGFDLRQADEFRFIEDKPRKDKLRRQPQYRAVDVLPDTETARGAAAELLRRNEIEIRPFGNFPKNQAVQGPDYVVKETISEAVLDARTYSERFQAELKKHEHEPKTEFPVFSDGEPLPPTRVFDNDYDFLVDGLIDLSMQATDGNTGL